MSQPHHENGYRASHGFVDMDFGPMDVECPVCGTQDNHADNRRGLCCDCYCALANKVGEAAFQAMDAATLVREATQAAIAALKRGTYHIGRCDKSRRDFAARHGITISRQAEAVAKGGKRDDAEAARRYADVSKKRQRDKDRERRARHIAEKYGKGFACAAPKPEPAEALPEDRRAKKRTYMRAYFAAHREEIYARRKAWRRAKKAAAKAANGGAK